MTVYFHLVNYFCNIFARSNDLIGTKQDWRDLKTSLSTASVSLSISGPRCLSNQILDT